MPLSHTHFVTSLSLTTLLVEQVSHDRGGRAILRNVSFTVGPLSRIGIIGANGAGKSTLLQVMAGERPPDLGAVTVEPADATVGYLAQEHDSETLETVGEYLARRTGVTDAELFLRSAASDLAIGGQRAATQYEAALVKFDSLGAADLDARIAIVLGDLGLDATVVDQKLAALSGGQRAKVALAAVELSRYDMTLLDEPTNDLDFKGLDRLESWVGQAGGGVVIVSHDRQFLRNTVETVIEIDESSHQISIFEGGWSGYERERARSLARAKEAFGEFERQRDALAARADQQRQWSTKGVRREKRDPRDHDVAQRNFRIERTENLAHRARQIDRARDALATVDKPFEGWRLQFTIKQSHRSGEVVARIIAGVVSRGEFQLGPLDLEITYGDRMVLTGSNGSGKSTLIALLLGTLALDVGEHFLGSSVIVGQLNQDRGSLDSEISIARTVQDRCGLTISEARSLLAKFGLEASHVTRPLCSLSPGERIRAELAMFQARGVNFLVLDEPTNHLDLPAITQLELALQSFTGTVLLVSHDRQMLSSYSANRSLELRDGQVHALH